MRDDAVAPVIAIMLILAVIVTFYSVWNALLIPSLKQSSEIEHDHNVESAFRHFSSDIEKAVALRQDKLVFSEPVQLGGGDVMLDSLRSSGSLYVRNESKPAYTLTLYDGSGTELNKTEGMLVNISYEPQNNYWQDQGYRWQYGYINVTKNQRQTPVSYYNMTDVENTFEGSGALPGFAGSFTTTGYSLYPSSAGNCSGLDFLVITIIASPDQNFVSSNGFGTLKLISHVNRSVSYPGVSLVTMGSDRDFFGKSTVSNWNARLSTISGVCKNIQFDSGASHDNQWYYGIDQTVSPVDVTLSTVTVEVSVN